MIFSLLAETETDGTSGGGVGSWLFYVLIGVLFIALIVWWYFGSKKRKKQEKDARDLINAVKPGNKVKTIGGICGIVVEVDSEENTFVLETGTELSGKCYLKFDKQAIYQTDAVVEPVKPEEIKEEPVPAEGEVTATEITAGETLEDTVEVTPVDVENENTENTEQDEKPASEKSNKNKK